MKSSGFHEIVERLGVTYTFALGVLVLGIVVLALRTGRRKDGGGALDTHRDRPRPESKR